MQFDGPVKTFSFAFPAVSVYTHSFATLADKIKFALLPGHTCYDRTPGATLMKTCHILFSGLVLICCRKHWADSSSDDL